MIVDRNLKFPLKCFQEKKTRIAEAWDGKCGLGF